MSREVALRTRLRTGSLAAALILLGVALGVWFLGRSDAGPLASWWAIIGSAVVFAALLPGHLRDSRIADRLALAARHAVDLVALADARGRLEYANDAFLQAVGLTANAAQGRPLCDCLGALDPRSRGIERVEHAMRQASPLVACLEIPQGSDQVRHVQLVLTPVLGAHGKLDGWAAVLRDETERIEADREHRRDLALLDTALRTMDEGLVMHRADGTIDLVNPAAERILGLSAEQIRGRVSSDPRWKCLHENGRPFAGPEHPAMVTLRTGVPQNGVLMGVRQPSGEQRWISISSRTVNVFGPHEPARVVVTFRDVTEERQTERDLRKLTRAVDQSPVMTVITDAQRRIEYVNAAFLKVTGYAREEVLGQHPRLLTSMDTPRSTLRSIRDALHAGTEWRGEVHNRRRDGSVFPVSFSLFPCGMRTAS